MCKKIQLTYAFAIIIVLNLLCARSYAQFSLTGQLRVRGELRDGFSNLLPSNDDPAKFISQRTRLMLGYKLDRLAFGGTLQDVRVWGQDASSISNADANKLMVHEAWAEVILADKADSSIKFKLIDKLSFKIGRQELVYDDSRLIGNLDWAQQGRRFDMALLKALHKGWQVDIGYAFNQNSERLSGSFYVPGNIPQYIKNDIGVLVPTPQGMVPLIASTGNSSASGSPAYTNAVSTNGSTQNFKNFLSVYVSKKIKDTKISGLFFKDDFDKYRTGSVAVGGGNVYGRFFDVKGINNRYTYGGMLLHSLGNPTDFGKLNFQGAYYQQSGSDRDGKNLDAYHYTVSLNYTKDKLSFGPGYDVLSGDKNSTPTTESKRFDPLYGTPHKFWGLMDFFYASAGSPAQGLKNAYFKAKYSANRYFVGLDYHYFEVANAISGIDNRKLGDEIDLTLGYTLNKFTTVDLGYSVMKATDVMPMAKGQATVASNFNKTPQWAYLMINIKPDFLFNNKHL